jgi:SAM-dependent methyltransferase
MFKSIAAAPTRVKTVRVDDDRLAAEGRKLVPFRMGDPAMNSDVTRDHYARLAATYDENWVRSPGFVDWMTGCIQGRLRLGPGDVAVDVGGGTGLFARGLAGYASAVVCAEPSGPMLARLPGGGRLIPVAASAEDVASGRVALPHAGYDAVLLKEMLHHVSDRAGVIAGLAGLLRPGGRMLVVMLPTQISYPLFPAALDLFEQQQPDPADITGLVRAAGLATEVSYDSFPLTFPTERYLQMVANRYLSLLSHFDDDQLDDGIAQIRRAHPGEEISFRDTFAFILGTAENPVTVT